MIEVREDVGTRRAVVLRAPSLALLVEQLEHAPQPDEDCEAAGVIGAARIAFSEDAPSTDEVFAALLGGGPLSQVPPFVLLQRDGAGIRVFARGALSVEELPSAPIVGVQPAALFAGAATSWVEALLPAARGVAVRLEPESDAAIELAFSTSQEAEASAAPELQAPREPAGERTSPEGDAEGVSDGVAEATLNPGSSSAGAPTFPVPVVDAHAASSSAGEHDGHTILSGEARRIRQQAIHRERAAAGFGDAPAPANARTRLDSADLEDSAELEDREELDDHGEHDGHTVRLAPSFPSTPSAPGAATPSAPRWTPGAEAEATVLAGAAPGVASPRASVEPERQPEPPRYVVELSTGGTVELNGLTVFGRAPSMGSEQTGGVQPAYMQLTGASDISRNHVLMGIEGGVIVVTDLHSRNGTDVIMPGRGPQRLRAGEPTAVMPGSVIDLGSGVALTVRR